MNNQVLTIEQMQELQKLGIDTSNASLYWYATDESEFVCFGTDVDKDCGDEICPTFTLQNILDVLPKSILGSTKQIKTVEFKLSIRENKIYYMQDSFNQQWLKCTHGKNLLEAAFNMLKWCKENNYI